MSTSFSINLFGSLTAKTGRKVQFSDFDVNKDNVISTKEYNSLVKELDLDKISFNKVDTDKDRKISQSEFELWEQKLEMQELLNEKLALLAANTKLSSSEKNEIKAQLVNHLQNFIENYTQAINKMSATYSAELNTKFSILVDSVLEQNKLSAKNNVLESLRSLITNKINNSVKTDNDMVDVETLKNDILEKLMTKLEKMADEYINNYEGASLEFDLNKYLNDYLTLSPIERLNSSVGNIIDKINSSEENESDESGVNLMTLKDDCRDLLKAAIENNIIIKLKGYNICTDVSITYVLTLYRSYKELLTDIKNALKDIGTEPTLDSTISLEVAAAEENANKKFLSVKGSAYQVDYENIDFSWAYAKYGASTKEEFAEKEIHERGEGWSGSKNRAYDEGAKLLDSEELKSQFKNQISEKLKEYNIPFSKIERVFENVYNDSVAEALNVEDMITGRGARGLSSKGHAYINVQRLLNVFIDKFNVNIETAINNMNKSQYDIDTEDMDFSEVGIGCDEYGEDFAMLYKTGKEATIEKRGAEYYINIASKILDTLKTQLENKAKEVCLANNVNFDKSAFDTIFEASKVDAINKAVKGVDEEGRSRTGMIVGSSITAATGAAGFITGAALGTAVSSGLSTLFSITLSTSWMGPLGMGIGAAIGFGVSALLGCFSEKDKSESTINTKLLVDTFLEKFVQMYDELINNMK